jgi:putative zinc finger protein
MDADGFAKMQEFAPKNMTPPPPPQGHWPTAEELAAYIDGTLEKAEAKRITEHLASCEECYSVYAETLQFQLESEPVEAGKVVQFPTHKQSPVRWWYAAAALLVLGLGLGWYLFQTAVVGPAPTLQVADAVPDLKGMPVQGLIAQYTRFRGDGNNEPTDLGELPRELERQSFQVGWLLVDFHVAASAKEVELASESWRKIGSVFKDASMVEEGARIQAEANRIDPETSPTAAKDLPQIVARAAETEARMDDLAFFPTYVDFGKWAEAGQIAAKVKDRSFFASRKNHRFLFYALKNREIKPEPEVRQQLQAIARIWGRGDFPALSAHFKAILDQYDFTS